MTWACSLIWCILRSRDMTCFFFMQRKAGPLSLSDEAREAFENREEGLINPSVDKSVAEIRKKVLKV